MGALPPPRLHRVLAPLRRLHRLLHRRAKLPSRPALLPLLLLPLPLLLFLLLPAVPLRLPHVTRLPSAPPADPVLHTVDSIVDNSTSPTHALLHHYRLPPAVVAALSPPHASALYWKLVYADVVSAMRFSHTAPSPPAAPPPPFKPAARLLFIHAQNGLGNRLRALASGLTIARATARVPVVVWERDAHLGASFHRLFETRAFGSDIDTVLYKDLVVLDSFPSWPVLCERNDAWVPVNYMLKDGLGASHNVLRFHLPNAHRALAQPNDWIDSMGGRAVAADTTLSPASAPGVIPDAAHLYLKTAYVVFTDPGLLSAPEHVNRELMRLHPSRAVLDIFETQDRAALDRAIGIHIRSRTLANDNVDVDANFEYTRKGAQRTNYWRAKSQFPVFLERMRACDKSRKDRNAKFFVAADDVALVRKLELEFPGRVLSITRNCDDRDEDCVLYAMADLLCLARTRKIYGSHWSSFTEAAARLGNKKAYLSGVDFGKSTRKRTRRKVKRTLVQRIIRTWRKRAEKLRKRIVNYYYSER